MMEKRLYAFAGLEFSVQVTENDRLYEDDGQLSAFRVEEVQDPHRFSFHLTEQLPAPSGKLVADYPGFRVYEQEDAVVRYQGSIAQDLENAYICEEHRGKCHRVYLKRDQIPKGVGAKTFLKSIMVEHLVTQGEGVIFHCSYIDWQGRAVLFTAPSETGKSTQAELWKYHRGAQIINGDRAVIRVADGNLMAEGIPFAGSSPYCENRSLPVAAIVYLAQAPHTTIRRISSLEAFFKIWEGISVNTWMKEDVDRASQTAQKIAESIPVFYMPCTPDESAVTALEQELRKLVDA